MGLGLSRKTIGEKQAAMIWAKQFTGSDKDGCDCPICTRTMKEVAVEMPNRSLYIDVCQPCNFVWFDAGELEYIPPKPLPAHVLGEIYKSKMNQEQVESFAFVEAQRLADEDRQRNPEPYEDWKTIPGLLGLPVELDSEPEAPTAWATWLTAFAIAAVSIAAFTQLQPIVNQYGLIPHKAWRYCGLTFITSFFLHGGWGHLIGNLYFLVIFGRAVERDLGLSRWLLLLLAANITGDLLDILIDPRGDLPTIGASGGISGLLVYYALKFPNAQFGLPMRFGVYIQWIDIPAWMCFVIWILLQFIGAGQQMSGVGNVDSLAHLGGVATGVFLWLLWRNDRSGPGGLNPNRSEQIEVKVQ